MAICFISAQNPRNRGLFNLGLNKQYYGKRPSFTSGINGGFNGGFNGGLIGTGGYSSSASSSSCRYWCQTPQRQYYCCESSNQSLSPVGQKPGKCPPIRPVCPPTRLGPPKTCLNDYSCRGSDKCCFDTCLRQRVCKPCQRNW